MAGGGCTCAQNCAVVHASYAGCLLPSPGPAAHPGEHAISAVEGLQAAGRLPQLLAVRWSGYRCMISAWKPVTAQLQAGQLGLVAQCCLKQESQ